MEDVVDKIPEPDLLKVIGKALADDHRRQADLLDTLRLSLGSEDPLTWNALLYAINHLRGEAERRDPDGMLYGIPLLGDDNEPLNALQTQYLDLINLGMDGKWVAGGFNNKDLFLVDKEDHTKKAKFVFKGKTWDPPTDSLRDRQERTLVSFVANLLNSVFERAKK